MKDERLMRDLAEQVRDQRENRPVRLDERWERLAAGMLSEEERAELEAWAETSEEARRMWALCQPVSSEARQEIVDRIRTQPAESTRSSNRTSTRNKPRDPSHEPGWRLSGRAWWWAPAAMAATTVAAVLILWPGGAPVPLPEYSVELSGGVQTQRSPDLPPSVPVFETGTRFELTLRPRTRVEGPLEVRGFLSPTEGSDGLDLDPWLSRSASEGSASEGRGAVTLDGIVGQDIELRPGTWDLWLVIARSGAMPEVADLEADLARGITKGPGWVVATPTRALQMRER